MTSTLVLRCNCSTQELKDYSHTELQLDFKLMSVKPASVEVQPTDFCAAVDSLCYQSTEITPSMVSDAILFGGPSKYSKNYSNCMGKR